MAGRRTTIIIPNFNGMRHLPSLWASLRAQTATPARILLVDNGSTDGSANTAPVGVDVVRLKRNYGFAYAVNRGIEESRTEFVAILNNDIVLHPDWLRHLEEALDNHSNAFACPLLLSATDPGSIDGAFDLLTRSGCAARALHGESIHHPGAQQPRTIHFPPMTAALFRRSLFDCTGLLDESFGSYYEDVELGLRAALQNLSGCYIPQASAVHYGSATLGTWSPASTYLIARNQLMLVAKHYPSSLMRSWWWHLVCGNILFLLLSLKRGMGWPALRGKLAALRCWSSIRGRVPVVDSSNQPTSLEIPATDLRSVIEQSEAAWHRLAGVTRPQTFWRIYFRLCRSAHLPVDLPSGEASED